jgi:hypothetical protein
VSLKLLGEEVGYFLNDVAYGGITYRMGDRRAAARSCFADRSGRLSFFDRRSTRSRARHQGRAAAGVVAGRHPRRLPAEGQPRASTG